MSYYIIRKSKYNSDQWLFLVDRAKNKSIWWSQNRTDAFKIELESKAKEIANGLKYCKTRIVDSNSIEVSNIVKTNIDIDFNNAIKCAEEDAGMDYLLDCGDR